MTYIQILPVKRSHIEYVAQHMRQADIDEVGACGYLPHYVLTWSVALSAEAWCGLADGVPVVIFGVTEQSPEIGMPWLLATDDIIKYQITFLRRSNTFIKSMRQKYRLLKNHVDTRNKRSIQWLRWLGFAIGDPVPWGTYGLMFHPFEMRVRA